MEAHYREQPEDPAYTKCTNNVNYNIVVVIISIT